MIHYGDWLSYWCAIAHNTDPSPVSNIDRLKKNLVKFNDTCKSHKNILSL